MLAWDLDKDTHSYLRQYILTFINQRKISKEMKSYYKKVIYPLVGQFNGYQLIDIPIPSKEIERTLYNPFRRILSYRISHEILKSNLLNPLKKSKKLCEDKNYSNIVEIDVLHKVSPNQREAKHLAGTGLCRPPRFSTWLTHRWGEGGLVECCGKG